MQKILITVAILFCFFALKAQTITIKCTFGSDCFVPNPEEFISYSFDVTPGWTASNISWTAPGATYQGSGIGSVFQVIWPNNTAAKSVKVTATLTNGGSSTSKSDTKMVTVKQISTIPSMTVTGTGVSGTFSNNGTVAVPCGTRTLNISVPTPSTSPSSGVTYTWTLPTGWTGSSTTNTISASADADGSRRSRIDQSRVRSRCYGLHQQADHLGRPRASSSLHPAGGRGLRESGREPGAVRRSPECCAPRFLEVGLFRRDGAMV